MSTISAILALEVELHEQNEIENDNKNMKKQIDYLTTELEKLKNQVNRQHPRRK